VKFGRPVGRRKMRSKMSDENYLVRKNKDRISDAPDTRLSWISTGKEHPETLLKIETCPL
jgi:hypothetical protein